MKLYAKIITERAEEAQGGNTWLAFRLYEPQVKGKDASVALTLMYKVDTLGQRQLAQVIGNLPALQELAREAQHAYDLELWRLGKEGKLKTYGDKQKPHA